MRTHEHEIQYRGENLISKMAEAPFFICGCGALGSNLIFNMVRQGFKKISVIDFDRVEKHNIQTQAFGLRDVGMHKAKVLSHNVFYNLDISVEGHIKKLDESNIKKYLLPKNIVVDTFDNSESRGLVTEYCKDKGLDCLHIGLYKDYAEVIWNESYRVPKNTNALDVCEYPLARNIIMMAVAVGAEVLIKYLQTDEKRSYTITLGDFKISEV